MWTYQGVNVVNVRKRRAVREHVTFMTTNSDVSATAHQIAELCEWRGERAHRPNQANGFNEEDIDTLIEYHCTGWASVLIIICINYYFIIIYVRSCASVIGVKIWRRRHLVFKINMPLLTVFLYNILLTYLRL